MAIYIYRLDNIETGMTYVGMTQYPDKRWIVQKSQAKAGKPGPLMDALREFGSDVFVQSIVEVVEEISAAYEAERAWITKLGTLAPSGYNIFLGKKWDAKTRAAQVARKTGVPKDEATRLKIRVALNRPEIRAKIREGLATSEANARRTAHHRRTVH